MDFLTPARSGSMMGGVVLSSPRVAELRAFRNFPELPDSGASFPPDADRPASAEDLGRFQSNAAAIHPHLCSPSSLFAGRPGVVALRNGINSCVSSGTSKSRIPVFQPFSASSAEQYILLPRSLADFTEFANLPVPDQRNQLASVLDYFVNPDISIGCVRNLSSVPTCPLYVVQLVFTSLPSSTSHRGHSIVWDSSFSLATSHISSCQVLTPMGMAQFGFELEPPAVDEALPVSFDEVYPLTDAFSAAESLGGGPLDAGVPEQGPSSPLLLCSNTAPRVAERPGVGSTTAPRPYTDPPSFPAPLLPVLARSSRAAEVALTEGFSHGAISGTAPALARSARATVVAEEAGLSHDAGAGNVPAGLPSDISLFANKAPLAIFGALGVSLASAVPGSPGHIRLGQLLAGLSLGNFAGSEQVDLLKWFGCVLILQSQIPAEQGASQPSHLAAPLLAHPPTADFGFSDPPFASGGGSSTHPFVETLDLGSEDGSVEFSATGEDDLGTGFPDSAAPDFGRSTTRRSSAPIPAGEPAHAFPLSGLLSDRPITHALLVELHGRLQGLQVDANASSPTIAELQAAISGLRRSFALTRADGAIIRFVDTEDVVFALQGKTGLDVPVLNGAVINIRYSSESSVAGGTVLSWTIPPPGTTGRPPRHSPFARSKAGVVAFFAEQRTILAQSADSGIRNWPAHQRSSMAVAWDSFESAYLSLCESLMLRDAQLGGPPTCHHVALWGGCALFLVEALLSGAASADAWSSMRTGLDTCWISRSNSRSARVLGPGGTRFGCGLQLRLSSALGLLGFRCNSCAQLRQPSLYCSVCAFGGKNIDRQPELADSSSGVSATAAKAEAALLEKATAAQRDWQHQRLREFASWGRSQIPPVTAQTATQAQQRAFDSASPASRPRPPSYTKPARAPPSKPVPRTSEEKIAFMESRQHVISPEDGSTIVGARKAGGPASCDL